MRPFSRLGQARLAIGGSQDVERRRGNLRASARAFLFSSALLLPTPSHADADWVALTMAPDGAWGAAASPRIDLAMIGAIQRCKERSSRRKEPTGCGSIVRVRQDGWGVAATCNGHWNVFVYSLLQEAELAMEGWQRRISLEYEVDLSNCREVTVGPDGAQIHTDRQARRLGRTEPFR